MSTECCPRLWWTWRRTDAHPSQEPWLLWTWVYMRSPRDDGLSSDEEAPTLYKIEDALAGLLGNSGAKLVGRITGGGRREFYFYSPRSEDMDSAVEKVR